MHFSRNPLRGNFTQEIFHSINKYLFAYLKAFNKKQIFVLRLFLNEHLRFESSIRNYANPKITLFYYVCIIFECCCLFALSKPLM